MKLSKFSLLPTLSIIAFLGVSVAHADDYQQKSPEDKSGFSQVAAEPGTIEFIEAPLGRTTVHTLTVSNHGTVTANIQDISATPGIALASDCTPLLQAKTSCLINVSVTPTELNAIAERVTIVSDSRTSEDGEELSRPTVQVIEVTGSVRGSSSVDVLATGPTSNRHL